MLIFQLDIEYKDGTKETIVSDESFLTADSPVVFSLTLYGEKYDARLEIKDWCVYGSDVSNFEPVEITEGFGGELRKTKAPPIRIKEELEGKEIKPGIFDFGKITAGHAQITITGKRDSEIILHYGERLTPDGLHAEISAWNSGPFPEIYNSDVYILDGEPNKTFEQLMSFHGFRYVEVIGEYESISMKAFSSFTDIPETGKFVCSNDILNKIHKASINSMLTCYQGMPLDNPKRDAPWLGDIMLDAENYAQNFDSYNTLYEYCLTLIDAQHKDGYLPWMAPINRVGMYNRGRFVGPDWGDGALLHIVYYVYKYTGNKEILLTAYPYLQKTLAYFKSLTEDNLIPPSVVGTGDWSCVYIKDRAVADISVMSNLYYYLDLKMMAELSVEIEEDSEKYRVEAQKTREAFRNKYIGKDGFKLSHISERICCSYVGLLEKEEIEKLIPLIVNEIVNDGYAFNFGVHGIKMVASLLTDYGYEKVVYDTLINDRVLGYAKNIKDDIATLPERFDYEPKAIMSLNHHFFSVIDSWFFNYLAGIKNNGFGFKNIEINPVFIQEIDYVEAEMQGISVSYNREKIHISSPYDFTLTLNGKSEFYKAGEFEFDR